jgi:hypothetical protein
MAEVANQATEREDYVANLEEAHALAAIAQAEQLKRIADMMEGYLSIYADPHVFAGHSDKTDLTN